MPDLEFIDLLRSHIQLDRILSYPDQRIDYNQILVELAQLESDLHKL